MVRICESGTGTTTINKSPVMVLGPSGRGGRSYKANALGSTPRGTTKDFVQQTLKITIIKFK